MSEAFDPSRYYYSVYHIARDFIATAAPFGLFVAATALAMPSVYSTLNEKLSQVDVSAGWSLVMVLSGACALIAYVAGAICNRIFLLYRLFKNGRNWWFDFGGFYPKYAHHIKVLYDDWSGRTPDVQHDDASSVADTWYQIDYLIHIFRIENPTGYLHLYREYAFLFVYRQLVTYGLIFAALAAASGRWPLAIGGMLFAAVLFLVTFANVREAVESEINFITVTAKWERSKRTAA